MPIFSNRAQPNENADNYNIGDADPTTHAIRLYQEYAIQKLEDAQVSDVYVCDM